MSNKEKIVELKEEMAKMWDLMKRCGNKHPEQHYIIKDYVKKIQELENGSEM